MLKALKRLFQQEKEKYRIPRKVQDLIPINCVWKDGIFLCNQKYSMCYRFTDINYHVASGEDQLSMIGLYRNILNGLDTTGTGKITVYPHRMNRFDFEESVLMPLEGNAQDEFRVEFNDLILDCTFGDQGSKTEKYITISVAKRNIEEARGYFKRVTGELQAHFKALGSSCAPLELNERLRVLHNFFRPEESDRFTFDLTDFMRRGHDFKDYICPDSMEKHSDYLKIGNRYARVLFLKDLAAFIRDDIVDELTSVCKDMMLSIDIVPISTDEATREVERKSLGVEKNITDWQRRQNANNNFSAQVPYHLEQQRKEIKDFMDDLTKRNQRMMLACITMVITADTKEQLEGYADALRSIADNRLCQIAPLTFQQLDGLRTVLPIGPMKIKALRTLTTEALSAFMPFKVQEIQDKGGLFFGLNAISKNLILCNPENLLNQAMIVLGIPGSGKSFLVKLIIIILLLTRKNDDILICDPDGEYGHLVKALTNDSTIISLDPSGKDRLNPMYMVEGYGEDSPIADKSQFILSLIEQIDKGGVGSQHKSIIDRCVASVYEDSKKTGITPTLSTLREKLLEQPESQAKDIALFLELYTTGTLNIFGQERNVDLEKRVLVFDIHRLSSSMKAPGLLVITDTMINRVALNWKRGKRTHVFVDEYHVVFQNEHSAAFFTSAWRQFRKRNAYPTAITQNVEFLLDSVEASTMLSNSELIVMLNQKARDREKLGQLLNISDEQMGYVSGSEAGSGLIKYGSSLVPFVNHFPKNTKLYQLMTTTPGEGVFSKGLVS